VFSDILPGVASDRSSGLTWGGDGDGYLDVTTYQGLPYGADALAAVLGALATVDARAYAAELPDDSWWDEALTLTVVRQPEPGVLVVLTGYAVTADQVRAAADSLQRLSPAGFEELQESIG
jgi:hypothetical protein